MSQPSQQERNADPFRDSAPPADDPEAAPGGLELVREFVNTAELEAGTELLSDPAALRAWLAERGLIGARERLGEGDLERARSVREALRALLEVRGSGAAVGAAALRALNRSPQHALMRVAFAADGTPSLEPVGDGLDRALARLFAAIERASVEGTLDRLKICSDSGCRWAFYDRSKNRSRNWCDMATCGNRAKAREYRRRRKQVED